MTGWEEVLAEARKVREELEGPRVDRRLSEWSTEMIRKLMDQQP